MCGNALRCAAKLVWERRRLLLPSAATTDGTDSEPVLFVDTPAGTVVAYLRLSGCGQEVTAIRVDMGKPLFARQCIPCMPARGSDDQPVLMEEYTHNGRTFCFSSVLVGVPHTIIFVDEADDEELVRSLGPVMETDLSLFPQGTNVGFVQALPDNHLNYRVWERGVGTTLACGTGASAAAVVAAVLGHIDPSRPVQAHLAGGDLTLCVDMRPTTCEPCPLAERAELVERVWMEGPAEIAYEGVANVDVTPWSFARVLPNIAPDGP